MLVEQPSSGVCELHGAFENNIKVVTIPLTKIKHLAPLGATEESIFASPMVVCHKCRTVLSRLSGVILYPHSPTEETMPDGLIDKSSPLFPLLETFFHLQDLFPDLISDIYLVPPDEVANSRFADKPLNVVVGLKGFMIQSYTSWSVKTHKSAAHLWNTPNERGKFWSARTLRLLLALGKIHLGSTQFNVWVSSYTRIVSVEYFCTTPPRMVQLQPSKLFKVK